MTCCTGSRTVVAMTDNRENTSGVVLTWTSKKQWGSVGLTHHATAEINGETWSFTVDQPSKGYWVARAWRDGKNVLYRDGTTQKRMKDVAQAYANYAATNTCPECRNIDGHFLDCSIYRKRVTS